MNSENIEQMNPAEYLKNVLVTESKDFEPIRNRVDDRMIRLLHASLGINSELAELYQAFQVGLDGSINWVNVMEEAADCNWYCSVAIDALQLDPLDASIFEGLAYDQAPLKYSELRAKEVVGTMSWLSGNIADFIKKHMFYGKPLNVEGMKENIKKMLYCISCLCVISGFNIEEARKRNIAKLKVRYGDKFTEAAALNRDLETERSILEGKPNEETK